MDFHLKISSRIFIIKMRGLRNAYKKLFVLWTIIIIIIYFFVLKPEQGSFFYTKWKVCSMCWIYLVIISVHQQWLMNDCDSKWTISIANNEDTFHSTINKNFSIIIFIIIIIITIVQGLVGKNIKRRKKLKLWILIHSSIKSLFFNWFENFQKNENKNEKGKENLNKMIFNVLFFYFIFLTFLLCLLFNLI